ncbi:MAG TPA: choice-of-anchor D domain-containing protein [Actinomycetota bacterium]|nr:choice-of-anchor D domain-containing protein [Actinomycetota bacterium]
MLQSSRLAPARVGAWLAVAVLVVAALAGVAAPARAASGLTAFTVDSEAGDSIAAGQSVTFTSSNATITATGDDTALTMNVTDGTDHFAADLAAPTGGALTAGTYTTTRSGDASNAGLDVSGDGRSCSSSTGTMTVHEIAVDGSNALATLAVTYEQHCDGATPALFGELRFNSAVDYKAVSASPASIDFGTQPRHPSAPNPITITNTGSTAVTFGAASLKGTARADYSIDSDDCSGTSPAPTETCAVAIVFDPSSGASRPARVELPVDTARGVVVIPLTGKGQKHTTSVSIKVSNSRVNFNGSVTVTAHLEDHRKVHNRTLFILEKPYGGASKPIKSALVDRHGNLQAKVRLQKRASFSAQFGGDVDWKAATSRSLTVHVFASIKGRMIRNYSRSGSYALYHYKGSCTTSAHTRCPEEAVKVSPNHQGDTITATLQAFTAGKWHTMASISGPLSANSTAIVITYYTGPGVIGVNLRSHIRFSGDDENLARTSSWAYFRVTK